MAGIVVGNVARGRLGAVTTLRSVGIVVAGQVGVAALSFVAVIILGGSQNWQYVDQRKWIAALSALAVAVASEVIFLSSTRSRRRGHNAPHLVAAREQARRNVDEFMASLESPANEEARSRTAVASHDVLRQDPADRGMSVHLNTCAARAARALDPIWRPR